jgi:hypothetical protein
VWLGDVIPTHGGVGGPKRPATSPFALGERASPVHALATAARQIPKEILPNQLLHVCGYKDGQWGVVTCIDGCSDGCQPAHAWPPGQLGEPTLPPYGVKLKRLSLTYRVKAVDIDLVE